MAERAPEEVAPPVADVAPRRPRWALHALVYLLALGGLLAVTDLDSSWTFDDGAYATQVRVLEHHGDWAYPYRWSERDPRSEFAPVPHATLTPTAIYSYTKRPAWILVLQASTRLFGRVVGLYVPSVLGAVAAALVAWALAERLRPGSGALGFWAVALGPLLVHSSAMWAHTCGAALGGVLALVVADRATGRARGWHLPALAATAALLVSFRTEGAIVVLAAAAVLAALALREPTWARRARAALGTAAPLVVVAAATFLATSRWSARLAPGKELPAWDLNPADLTYVQSQWGGAWRTFLDGGGASRSGTVLAALVVLCWVAGAALLARREVPQRVAAAVLGAGVALLALRQYAVARFDLGGALLAAPLLPVALVALLASGRVRRPGRAPSSAPPATSTTSPASVWLGALVALHVLATIATQYPEGGGGDWGGRFLFVVLVPATVLAALFVVPLVADRTGLAARHAAVATLVALVALPTALGWASANDFRGAVGRTADAVEAPKGDTVIQLDRHLARGAWRLLPDVDLLSAEVSSAPRALAMLRPGLDHDVVVVGAGADRVRAPGYERRVVATDRVVFTPA
ncbi:hypothetical protein KSP35_02310 [Aquihabitans sp. G128]|uniref:hypothetical protein n=1 Tax=Aquihabitans sp. G128 TaxID=2849779 RepID=UPI001C24B4CB|nr:hypothetical protein [Aquihabitans sp. G128]QXC61700.1 hypothetical protein KSP35_02310 [Aquihabitans sp. G128]